MEIPVHRHGLIVLQALVSPEDYEVVSKYQWRLEQSGYVSAYVNGRKVRMHRLIMGEPPDDHVTDHINCVKHDNQRHNLRFSTFSQNAYNRLKLPGTSSEYKGVSWVSRTRKWWARVGRVSAGYHDTELAAGIAADKLALSIYGDGAILNVLKHAEINSVEQSTPVKRIGKRDLPTHVYRDRRKFRVACSIDGVQCYFGVYNSIAEAQSVASEMCHKRERDRELAHIQCGMIWV